MTEKVYVRHTGYPGGQRFTTPKEMLNKKPFAVLEKAVKGMLPKTKLGDKIFGNLHVVVGSEHKFAAQQPRLVNINELK
jgi:large subunit ribosomal protein L13